MNIDKDKLKKFLKIGAFSIVASLGIGLVMDMVQPWIDEAPLIIQFTAFLGSAGMLYPLVSAGGDIIKLHKLLNMPDETQEISKTHLKL